MSNSSSSPKVRLKTVALPAEHGSWSFLFEPLVLGLLIAPTTAGVWLAIATTAAFLARQPTRILFWRWRYGRGTTARIQIAQRFTLLYGVIMFVAFGATLATAPSFDFLLPLGAGLLLATAAMMADATYGSRSWQVELLGPLTLSSTTAALAFLGGYSWAIAIGLWLLLAARALPTVLYVRAILRLIKKQPTSIWLPLAAHLLAFVGVWLFWPVWLVSGVYALLLGRAAWLLSPYRPTVTAKQLGITEVILGIIVVFAIGLTF